MLTNKIHAGDCLDILKTLPSDSIDSIVTDPPAGIGFMNLEFDSDKGGRDTWISWMQEIASECLRVLKPGAHALVWALPRTSHWTATAWENAGFEVRDRIAHVFGCLSQDTEILTDKGWVQYKDGVDFGSVLCYILGENKFEFHKPTEVFAYENEYPAYHIKSDTTDQLVSRNHRVIVERSGREVFRCSETLQEKESVPILESLHDLPETIPCIYGDASIKKQDLFKEMWLQKNQYSKERSIQNSPKCLSSLWERFSFKIEHSVSTAKVLLGEMLWGMEIIRQKHKRTLQKDSEQRQGGMDGRKQEILQCEHERREKSRLERWCDLFQNAWKLFRGKICTLSSRILRYGSERWICYGAPYNNGPINREEFAENRSSAPYKPRSDRQQDRKSNAVRNQSGSQTIRRTTATVKKVEYNGIMWCVQVPTGAFVSRRNGKIFITGNSGFPKSHNISKSIDKAAGAEREVLGKKVFADGTSQRATARAGIYSEAKGQAYETAPSTDDAKDWSGYGTALKPAVEDWHCLRKPIEKGLTIAGNCIKWGTGALDIDSTRVGTDDKPRAGNIEKSKSIGYGSSAWQKSGSTPPSGRYPSHLILDDSEEVEACFPYTKSGSIEVHHKTTLDSKGHGLRSVYGKMGASPVTTECSQGSAARYFKRIVYKPKPSPSERADSTHPTQKSIELMNYLIKLISRPGQIVLDPFAGSGTTLVAAKHIGREYIGIEKEEEYVEIIKARLKAPVHIQKPRPLKNHQDSQDEDQLELF